jgi:CheY-like chemotaxis protein
VESFGEGSAGVHLDTLRVVLVDDSSHFGDVIRSMLGGSFHVVTAVSDRRQAMIAVLDLDPDLLITDLLMTYLDGLQLAHKLRKASCRTKIIMLTMHNDRRLVDPELSNCLGSG